MVAAGGEPVAHICPRPTGVRTPEPALTGDAVGDTSGQRRQTRRRQAVPQNSSRRFTRSGEPPGRGFYERELSGTKRVMTSIERCVNTADSGDGARMPRAPRPARHVRRSRLVRGAVVVAVTVMSVACDDDEAPSDGPTGTPGTEVDGSVTTVPAETPSGGSGAVEPGTNLVPSSDDVGTARFGLAGPRAGRVRDDHGRLRHDRRPCNR